MQAVADPVWSYDTAFGRNIGWVSQSEQAVLRHSTAAIAGLGGVGGSHLLTLARLGLGAFRVADPDTFDLPNFNRQAGAFRSTLGEAKSDALVSMAREINPGLEIEVFGDGVTRENIDRFLDGVDVYVDGLDFFAMDIRRQVFAACRARGIPAVTAAPLGMSTAVLCFLPGSMSFERYFGLEERTEQEQLLRFLIGLAPGMLHRTYLVDPGTVDLAAHRGPSTAMACELCAGVAATEVLKLLLHRGRVPTAPRGLQFDAYRNRLSRTWRPGGNRHPLQRLAISIARRQLAKGSTHANPPPYEQRRESPAHCVLELARWAPSGDNSQPWRFEIAGERQFVVHGHDTREDCVYDLAGHGSQLALGSLLETIRIAATGQGLVAQVERRTQMPEQYPTFDVRLENAPGTRPDPLLPWIPLRRVNRAALSPRPLPEGTKRLLEAAAGAGHTVIWLEGWSARARMAALLFRNAGLRLRLPEAFELHRSIIEWNARHSETRLPDHALGLDPLTRRAMRHAMHSWQRMRFLNRYLGASLLPRLEMEVIPALLCGAHFAIVAASPPRTVDDQVAAGASTQRFWLTAARLGLQLQPAYTPLVFSEYDRDRIRFTADTALIQEAARIRARLEALLGEGNAARAVFLGRLGYGRPARARSTRRPLDALLHRPEPGAHASQRNTAAAPDCR